MLSYPNGMYKYFGAVPLERHLHPHPYPIIIEFVFLQFHSFELLIFLRFPFLLNNIVFGLVPFQRQILDNPNLSPTNCF